MRRTTSGPTGRWLVLGVVSLAFFMVELDITVVNVALPSIQYDLAFSPTDLHWVVNAYLLLFGGFLLTAGRAADLLGRKPMFLAGIATFGLGSVLSAIATSVTAMVIGRALQGLGGAMLTPTGLAIITTTFTDTRERTRALAVWTFVQTGSLAIGLGLGGLLAEVSWRWIFIINIPVTIAMLLAAPRLLPRIERDEGRRGLDVAGTIVGTAAPVLLIYALVNTPEWGWAAPRTIALLAAGAGLLAALVVIEHRSRTPLIRLSIFKIRTLAVGNASFFLSSSALFGMFFFSSLYLQNVLGWRPLLAGVGLLPLAAGVIGGLSAAPRLLDRFGPRLVGSGGLMLAAAGAVLLTWIPAAGAYVWPFLPGLFVLALGLGLSMVSLVMLCTSGVPEQDAGLASGLFHAISYLGGAVGLAVMATLAATRTAAIIAESGGGGPDLQQAATVGGYSVAFATAAGLLAAAALLLLVFISGRGLPTGDGTDSAAQTHETAP